MQYAVFLDMCFFPCISKTHHWLSTRQSDWPSPVGDWSPRPPSPQPINDSSPHLHQNSRTHINSRKGLSYKGFGIFSWRWPGKLQKNRQVFSMRHAFSQSSHPWPPTCFLNTHVIFLVQKKRMDFMFPFILGSSNKRFCKQHPSRVGPP